MLVSATIKICTGRRETLKSIVAIGYEADRARRFVNHDGIEYCSLRVQQFQDTIMYDGKERIPWGRNPKDIIQEIQS